MATLEQQFHAAVEQNDSTQVQKLIKNGVSVNCLHCNMSPIQLAISKGHEELAVLLLEHKCDIHDLRQQEISLFEQAMLARQYKVVASLMTRRVSPNKQLSFGDSPLSVAVEIGCAELVKLLIKGNVNVNSFNLRRESALYIACQEGHTEIAHNLIEAGANYNCVHHNSEGFTPLLVAVANDNKEVVELLLTKNVHLDAQDVDGWTSLWHAYSNDNEEICSILLKAGASVHVPNNEGQTVFQEALEDEDDDFSRLFRPFIKKSIPSTKVKIGKTSTLYKRS